MKTLTLNQLQQDLQPTKLISIISAGLVLGVVGVLTYITPMAALIFSGDLAPYLSAGISLSLLSAAVVAIVAAFSSSFIGTLALPVPEEMTILATVGVAIATQMPKDLPPETLFVTVVAAIALSSVVTGLFLLTLGQLRLGQLIRFLPYPVVGGFLGGLGGLITLGSLAVMTGLSVNVANLSTLFSLPVLVRWLPGLALALFLLWVLRRYSHFLILPATFLAATGIFYSIWFATGHTLADAGAQGWLLGPFPEGSAWQPMSSLQAFRQAHWAVIWPQLGTLMTVMLITALSLLLVSSGIELATEQDIDLNQELRSIGLGCLISGLLGGTVGSHGVTTVLVHKMGAQSRLVGLITALVYLVVLWAGISIVSFFPKPVLGGLLLYLSLDLMVTWLYDSWFKLPRIDYAIVLLISAIIVGFGFVKGVALGLVIAIGVFVWNYSHIPVAKHALSGQDYQSRQQRPITQERLLRQKGDQVYILQLQGLIFFGTAHRLLQQVRQRLSHPHYVPLKFLILDFHLVSGLDSSAVLSFVKLKQLAQQASFDILLTQLTPPLLRQLQQAGVVSSEHGMNSDTNCDTNSDTNSDTNNHEKASASAHTSVHVFDDLDQGMQWCEESILEGSQFRRQRTLPMSMHLKTLLADYANAEQISHLMAVLEEKRYTASETLFQAGDLPQALYFIETGHISLWQIHLGERTQRLQTLGPGTILGERSFFTKVAQETVAIADDTSKIYQLSLDQWQQLKQTHPQTAAMFSEFMNALLCERLARTQKEVTLLMQG
jgi:sulfate permease, SulP family